MPMYPRDWTDKCQDSGLPSSTWEIRSLDTSDATTESPRCLLTICWRYNLIAGFHGKKAALQNLKKTIPYAITVPVAEEFYDAIAADTSEDEDSDDDIVVEKDHATVENGSSGVGSISKQSLQLPYGAADDASRVFESATPSVPLATSQFCSSLREGKDDDDINCWTNPGGSGFMIRGQTYLKDYAKVGFLNSKSHLLLYML
ncbi:Protein ENHANCED DISEASE RESISTANCE 2-like [Bienertia sinuspersici]